LDDFLAMKKVTLSSLCLALTLCVSGPLQAQKSDIDLATEEGARRQALKIELDRKLAEAQAAEKRGAFLEAAQAYTESLDLAKKVSTGVEIQHKQALEGFVATRLQLAEQAERAQDYAGADDQYARILREDPKNERVLQLRQANKETLERERGMRPSQAAIDKMPEIYTNRINAATLVQDAKIFFEAERLDEAETRLKQAIKLDPSNRAADQYLKMVVEKRFQIASLRGETERRENMLKLEQAWGPPIKRDLPVPNPMARTNLVYTGRGRQVIYNKLDTIRIDELSLDSIPLSGVIEQIDKTAKLRDPDKKGLNFIINNMVDPVAQAAPAIDPATGLPVAAAAPGAEGDITATTINLKPALRDLTLRQALDAITKVADRPIKYSVEEYAIVFSLRAAETPALHTRWFKIDPNTFLQGLQGVSAFDFGQSQGGGGGGGGGGGRGGGGGGRGGGGGGGRGGGAGGGGQGGQQTGGAEYVGVSLAGRQAGIGGVGGAAPAQPRQPGQPAVPTPGGAGVDRVTVVTPTEQAGAIARQFFTTAGVDFTTPGKQLFFEDRSGHLMVRATLQDLDIIEQAVQVLNTAPPQITIEAKFAEVTQTDSKALGFDWFLGNTVMFNGSSVLSGGSSPSFGSPSSSGSPANPSGVFPGPLPRDPLTGAFAPSGPGTIPASSSDNLITSGLRNSAPALGTLTGILTDPQFRVVIRALEQRQGVNLMAAPKVTTLSARQAQIKAVRVQYIVTDLDLNQTAGGGGGTVGGVASTGAGGVGSTVQPLAEAFELGPVLDVVPYVTADGYTIQMTIIPTVKEFEGYDLENAKLFSAQAQSVGGSGNNPVGNPLTQITPLPIFRLRQVVTSAIVWDGQTVVLGGLLLDQSTKMKDKVPFLGDMPFVGRLFRSESTSAKKTSLIIFVTPTIIDPAGNRVHSEEDLPFAQTGIPPQAKAVTQ
jgi:type II secretory pathway component GspD/PulD (secretin)/tetratricopeptide (TPR) repeat protein